MRQLTLISILLMTSGCASQSGLSNRPPPPYAPLVNDAVARYHRCLGYEMGGFLETGGNAQKMIDAAMQHCELELQRLDGELYGQNVPEPERQTVITEAKAEAQLMLQQHIQEVLAEQP